MKIRLNRFKYGPDSTVGRFFIDGVAFCYSLEDEVRKTGPKVQGETAIPAGEYRVVISMSKRFGRLMPELLNVKDFTGVRIHSGNTDDDTDGCILLGMEWDNENHISDSKTAFNAFFAKLTGARNRNEDVTILIYDV